MFFNPPGCLWRIESMSMIVYLGYKYIIYINKGFCREKNLSTIQPQKKK